jgi:hypothetical protein
MRRLSWRNESSGVVTNIQLSKIAGEVSLVSIDSKDRRSPNKVFVSLAIVSILAFSVVLFHTRLGVGTTGDSVYYLMGAENLIAGNGLSRTSGGGEIRPITGFPPLIFLALAAVDLLPGDVFDGIRILNALLFAANTFLVGLLINRYTNSLRVSIIGQVFVLTFQNLLEFHTWVLTEPLFIFLMLCAIYSLALYLDTNRVQLLLFASVAVSLVSLTRYVGVSLTMAGGLSVLLLSKSDLKRRLVDSVIFGGATFVPLLVWFRRNVIVSGTAANRAITYNPIPSQAIRIYIAEVLSWFAPRALGLPRPLRNLLVLLMTLPGLALFYYQEIKERLLIKERQREPFWTLPWILTFYILSYTAVLILNTAFLDPALTLKGQIRYLAPIYVTVVVLFAVILHRLLKESKPISFPRILVAVFVGVLFLLYTIQAWSFLRDPLPTIGYTGLRTLWPDTVDALDSLDPTAPLVTNNPEIAYILSGRPAYHMPIRYNAGIGGEREDYDAQIQATREKLEQGGVLFIFGPLSDHDREVIYLLDADILMGYFNSAKFGYPEAVKE